MQQRRGAAGNAVATAVVLFLIMVVVFAVFDPFHSGLWVYGGAAVATWLLITKIQGKAEPKAPGADAEEAAWVADQAVRVAHVRAKEEAEKALWAPEPKPPKPVQAKPISEPSSRPGSRLARAQRVWQMEREVGMEPWPIFGQTPPPPKVAPRGDNRHARPEVVPDGNNLPPATVRARREPGRDWGAVVRKSLQEANARAR